METRGEKDHALADRNHKKIVTPFPLVQFILFVRVHFGVYSSWDSFASIIFNTEDQVCFKRILID